MGVGDLQGGDQSVVSGQLLDGPAHVLVDGVDARPLGLRRYELLDADVLGGAGAAHVESRAQCAGEQLGPRPADHDGGAHIAQRHAGQGPAREGDLGRVVAQAPEPGGQGGGDIGVGGDDGG